MAIFSAIFRMEGRHCLWRVSAITKKWLKSFSNTRQISTSKWWTEPALSSYPHKTVTSKCWNTYCHKARRQTWRGRWVKMNQSSLFSPKDTQIVCLLVRIVSFGSFWSFFLQVLHSSSWYSSALHLDRTRLNLGILIFVQFMYFSY